MFVKGKSHSTKLTKYCLVSKNMMKYGLFKIQNMHVTSTWTPQLSESNCLKTVMHMKPL